MDPMESTSIIIMALNITGYPTDISMLHTSQLDLSIFTLKLFLLFHLPSFTGHSNPSLSVQFVISRQVQ